MTNKIYKRVEKNIAKIGPTTYRIRVGKYDGYASTRDEARLVKKALRNK